MPIYEYQCQKCEHTFEEWQKDFTERTIACPECGGDSQRLISNTAFILKGSGWYVTDYARNGGNGKNGNGKAEQKAETSKKESSSESTSTSDSSASKSTDNAAAKKSSDSSASSSASSEA